MNSDTDQLRVPVVVELDDGLKLEIPSEPTELRVQLRAKALEADSDAGSTYSDCFGAWLWERWRASLEPAGLDRERFFEIVIGYRREVWYWLLGDRSWDQLLPGLTGRVSRRVAVLKAGPPRASDYRR